MCRNAVAAIVLTSMLSLSMPASAQVIETTCQKNTGDGRILIQDDKVLPHEDSTFKVLRFKRTGGDDLWAEGPCTIRVTGRAR